MAYSAFARYYDALTGDVDYTARAAYFHSLIEAHGKGCRLLLDLACGTGSLSVALARLGYQVIGVDRSADMLAVAAEKNGGLPEPVLYLCQDMTTLDLYGTVQATVCALDSVNHITDAAKLRRVFNKVALFTEPGGVFLFDANTTYKHREVLGDNTFIYDLPELYCVWQNSLRGEHVDISLDFFERQPDGCWLRSSESFAERAYPRQKLCAMLEQAGFEVRAVYDDGTTTPPQDTTQREVYVAVKR